MKLNVNVQIAGTTVYYMILQWKLLAKTYNTTTVFGGGDHFVHLSGSGATAEIDFKICFAAYMPGRRTQKYSVRQVGPLTMLCYDVLTRNVHKNEQRVINKNLMVRFLTLRI